MYYYYQWPYNYYYQHPYYCNYTVPYYYGTETQYVDPNMTNDYQYTEQYYGENTVPEDFRNEENSYNRNNDNNSHMNHQQKIHHIVPQQNLLPKVLEKLEELQDKFEEIEKEKEDLKEKVENIKPINIENINYKIQELTVEELSGALNIGLSALTDAENLKKLLNENGGIKFNDLDTNDLNKVEEMDDYS